MMIDDRNKTEITKLVTAAAQSYLSERGCKPIETEVPIQEGWVADLGSVVVPTQTELQNLKLLRPRPRCKYVAGQYLDQGQQEWYDEARAMQQLMTVLVEVKTSRSDFCGDKKWALPVPTNLAYLAVPDDLTLSPAEIPETWGVLLYSRGRDCVRVMRVPTIHKVTTEQQLSVVYEIAVRRDHFTRYEREREFRREVRADQNQNKSLTRMNDAFRVMRDVVHAKHANIDETLQWHGISNLPEHMKAEYRQLWGIAGVPSEAHPIGG